MLATDDNRFATSDIVSKRDGKNLSILKRTKSIDVKNWTTKKIFVVQSDCAERPKRVLSSGSLCTDALISHALYANLFNIIET